MYRGHSLGALRIRREMRLSLEPTLCRMTPAGSFSLSGKRQAPSLQAGMALAFIVRQIDCLPTLRWTEVSRDFDLAL